MNSLQLDLKDVGLLHRNIVGINNYAYIKEYILYIFLNEMLMNIFHWTYPVKSSLINLTAPEWKDLGIFFKLRFLNFCLKTTVTDDSASLSQMYPNRCERIYLYIGYKPKHYQRAAFMWMCMCDGKSNRELFKNQRKERVLKVSLKSRISCLPESLLSRIV